MIIIKKTDFLPFLILFLIKAVSATTDIIATSRSEEKPLGFEDKLKTTKSSSRYKNTWYNPRICEKTRPVGTRYTSE